MRSAVLIVALLLVLGGAFFFLVVRDRPPTRGGPSGDAAPTTRRMVPSTLASNDVGESAIGQSSGVWLQSRDPTDPTGRIASEYLFEKLDPQRSGAVDVTRPQARFYGKSGGLMTLDGSTGTVAYSQAGSRGDPQAVGTATPTSGTLRDVTIEVFDDVDDAEPSLVATVPAVRFDAVDNRLATVDSVIDGRGVLAEQVPVTVRGRDYEFDGYGMVMRWNDRDGRLEQLVINRGERLLVRDVSRFTTAKPATRPATPTPAREDGAATRDAAPPRPRATAARRAEPTPATAPAADARELYRAMFDRDVRVTRGGVEVAQAETLDVVLPIKKTSPRPAAATAARAEPSAARSATRPARGTRRAATRPSLPTTAAAATRPADALEIRWTGKLTVRPHDADPSRVDDHVMVELVGSPARVAQDGATVEARRIHVEPDAGRIRVEPGGTVRAIALTGADGGQLRSRSALLIDRPAGRATIEGGGALVAPPDKSSGATTQPTVRWSRRMELALQDDDASTTPWLRAATIEGAARVDADAFAMTGDSIALGFDKPTAAPRSAAADGGVGMPASDARQLRLVVARGAARIESGTVEQRRSLAGDELRLGFAAGAEGPALTTLVGLGNVAMIDADGTEFASGSLDVATRPMQLLSATSRPADAGEPADAIAMIERLDARGDVRLKRADGTAASGDRLTLIETGGARRLALDGAPARAGTPRGEVVATRVEIDPATRDVRVPVPGRLVSRSPAQPGATTTVDWARAMTLDATRGECAIDGDVRIASVDARGGRTDAAARSMLVGFDPAALAATRPTSVPATSRPAIADSVRSLALRDDVRLEMIAADGRASKVETERLDVDVTANLVTADRAGRMLMITPPAAAATTAPTKGPAAMAVEWKGALRWALKPGTLAMTDGVRIGYDREGKNDVIRIDADRLDCTLAPIDLAARGGAAPTSVELRTIRAAGDVFVQSRLATFDAATLDYDLSRAVAQAGGDATRDVQVRDSTGASRVGFSAITWNVETGEIEDFRNIGGQLQLR